MTSSLINFYISQFIDDLDEISKMFSCADVPSHRKIEEYKNKWKEIQEKIKIVDMR